MVCPLPLEEEVLGIVSALALNISLRLDVFTGGFFKQFWLVIKWDVIHLIHDFFNG